MVTEAAMVDADCSKIKISLSSGFNLRYLESPSTVQGSRHLSGFQYLAENRLRIALKRK